MPRGSPERRCAERSQILLALEVEPRRPTRQDRKPICRQPVGEHRRDRSARFHADTGEAGHQRGLEGAEATGGRGGRGERRCRQVDGADLGNRESRRRMR